ncbi:MAG: hypothetical protein KHZ27_08740 [Fusobacterium sp.]|nr:hypothetical protein [Fusobacterium sp.]
MENEEKLHKEIDLVQGCINRISNNSFLLKGWTISINGVILALFSENINKFFIGSIIMMITFIFWCLDTYYLRLERMFRRLYDWKLEARKKGNEEKFYSLDIEDFKNEVDGVIKTMFSKTLFLFYGFIIILVFVILIFYYFSNNFFIIVIN